MNGFAAVPAAVICEACGLGPAAHRWGDPAGRPLCDLGRCALEPCVRSGYFIERDAEGNPIRMLWSRDAGGPWWHRTSPTYPPSPNLTTEQFAAASEIAWLSEPPLIRPPRQRKLQVSAVVGGGS